MLRSSSSKRVRTSPSSFGTCCSGSRRSICGRRSNSGKRAAQHHPRPRLQTLPRQPCRAFRWTSCVRSTTTTTHQVSLVARALRTGSVPGCSSPPSPRRACLPRSVSACVARVVCMVCSWGARPRTRASTHQQHPFQVCVLFPSGVFSAVRPHAGSTWAPARTLPTEFPQSSVSRH